MKKQRTKGYYAAFAGIVFLLSVIGVIGLFLIDENNGLRGEAFKDNFMSQLIVMFRLPRINIGGSAFLSFAVAYLATWVFAGALVLMPVFRGVAERKSMPENKFRLLFYGIPAGVFVLGWAAALIFYGVRVGKVGHIFLMFLYFIITLVVFAVAAAVVYVLVRLVMMLVSYIKKSARAKKAEEKGEEPAALPAEVAPAPSQAARGAAPEIVDTGEMFPGLTAIDRAYAGRRPAPVAPATVTLPGLVEGFQAFLSEKQGLYYDLSMLRSFLAGMSASRLIILEGLSGTGKSSLPRYFSEYVGSKAFFAPVQSTWRDRTDVLGFYNDFSKVFKETAFLKCLYEADYTPEKFNLMVLDEMNLSRVEYYFADFLSVLEYPAEDWKVTLMQHVAGKNAPKRLAEGAVRIPVNTWFIGTANKDDSTFTITDKVYDRAVVLDFMERNTRTQTKASPEPITLSPAQLGRLFEAAQSRPEYRLSDAELAKFNALAQFVYDTFEIQFGNRIMNQITVFTPVYVALGGTKEEALDIMFSRKVLHKLEGRFEDYIKDGLVKLQSKVSAAYGSGVMTATEGTIKRLLKKLV